jgi:hypothetical protein
MTDLTVTVVIHGGLSHLAKLAMVLQDLSAEGVPFTLTLSVGEWEKTYTSKDWPDEVRSFLYPPPPS